MATPVEKAESAGRTVWRAGIALVVYLVAFAVFAWFASRHCPGSGLTTALVFVECALGAVLLGVFVVELDPRRLGVVRFAAGIGGLLAGLAVASALVLVAARLLWGAVPLVGALYAQVVIVSFCVLLASVFALVRCSGSELFFAQLVCIFVACVLMGTVFYADPVIESQGTAGGKRIAIAVVLATNPLGAISDALEFGWMHEDLMYRRFSVIGRWYYPSYPEWWGTASGYLAVSAVLLVGAGLLLRHRVLQTVEQGGM
jgi:hypothetical protein